MKRLAFVYGENPVYFLIGEFTNPGPSMENEYVHIHYYAVVYTCALWYSNMALENALSMELCRMLEQCLIPRADVFVWPLKQTTDKDKFAMFHGTIRTILQV